MKTKHCQHCGKLIALDAEVCTYCGAKQEMPVGNEDTFTEPGVANSSSSQFTHTDLAMIIVNGLSAIMQFLYGFQTMMMPLSKSDGEGMLILILMLLGVIVSGIDCYEKHVNHTSQLISVLGIVGNIAGIGLAAIIESDVMTIIGAIVLGISLFMAHQSNGKRA